MDTRKLFSNLLYENNPQRSYFIIEALVFNIIKMHLAEKHKPFFTNYAFGETQDEQQIVDGYAPEGFDELIGETILELKTTKIEAFTSHDISNTIDRIISIRPTVRNIVFIFANGSDTDKSIFRRKAFVNKELRDRDLPNIVIWDNNELNALFNKYPNYIMQIYDNINELIIDSRINESISRSENKRQWIYQRQNYILNLKKQFNEDNLVLFVGAGVSIGAGIPTWDGLVTDLLVSLISTKLADVNVHLSDEEKNIIIKNLKNANGNSPLLLARYVKKGLDNGFVPILSECLYKNCSNKSDILKAISNLCLPQRNAIGIKAVVTYNFDDLVEFNFQDRGIKYKSIYYESEFPTKKEIGIYHVHGFLPRNLQEYPNVSKSLLVFSEDGYHNLMLDPYNWSNLTQLNFLRENTCLFIGLSITDPNLRRILDIAMRKQEKIDIGKHYVILKRDMLSSVSESSDNVNIDNLERFDYTNLKLEESFFRELGLNVIWIDSYNEIPSVLNQIRS